MEATTPTASMTEPTFVQRWTWPAAIVGLLLVNAGITAALVIRSSNDPSFAAESNAYEKAVRWDEHLAQLKFNALLGWSTRIAVVPTADGRHDLTVTLRDASGKELSDATIRAEVFHHARAADVRALTLASDGSNPGVYRATMAVPRAGLWQVRLTVTRFKDTFTSEETVTVNQADFATVKTVGEMQ